MPKNELLDSRIKLTVRPRPDAAAQPRTYGPSSESTPKLFGAGKTVVDYIAVGDPKRVPTDVFEAETTGTGKDTITGDTFDRFVEELTDRGFTFEVKEGGNINTVTKAYQRMDGGVVVAHTWAGDDERDRIEGDLRSHNVDPQVKDIPGGITPRGLVVPKWTEHGLDRVILSHNPDNAYPHFANDIPDGTQNAAINSLMGPYALPLMDGTQALVNDNVRFGYTPGTAQINDVAEGNVNSAAVLYTVGNAEVLNVNLQELATLTGMGQVPEDKRTLLESGLALNPNYIFATSREGIWAASQEGTMIFTPAVTAERVVDTTGAGDNATAAILKSHFDGGSMERSSQLGVTNGAAAVEQVGAATNLLTLRQLEVRRLKAQPTTVYLNK